MKRIGLLSDTHGHWDDRYTKHFAECDEIWHAGDIGSLERFRCEEADVLMKHIGGYPGHYDRSVSGMLLRRPPRLFIAGHSHILKVEQDRTLGLLHINPGAAGLQGWHRVRTLVRFTVDGADVRDLEVIELGEVHSD